MLHHVLSYVLCADGKCVCGCECVCLARRVLSLPWQRPWTGWLVSRVYFSQLWSLEVQDRGAQAVTFREGSLLAHRYFHLT